MNKSRFSQDFVIKFLSLALALTLWVYVQSQQPKSIHEGIQTFKQVDIHWKTADGYVVTAVTAQQARVTIAGPLDLISLVTEEDVVIEVDLTENDKGRYSVELSPSIPAGMRLFKVQPEKVDFVVDKWVERTLPVGIEYNPALPDNIIIRSADIQPSEVKINGAESLLQTVDRLFVTYDHTVMEQTVSGLSVVAKNAEGNNLPAVIIEEKIALDLVIEQSRLIPVVMSGDMELPAGKRLNIIPMNVLVTGSAENLAEIEKLELKKFDLALAAEEMINVEIDYPEGVSPFDPTRLGVRVLLVDSRGE